MCLESNALILSVLTRPPGAQPGDRLERSVECQIVAVCESAFINDVEVVGPSPTSLAPHFQALAAAS
jgi:hypothetical protein